MRDAVKARQEKSIRHTRRAGMRSEGRHLNGPGFQFRERHGARERQRVGNSPVKIQMLWSGVHAVTRVVALRGGQLGVAFDRTAPPLCDEYPLGGVELFAVDQ